MILGQVFVQLEVSRIFVVCTRTGRRRDVTVSVGRELLDLQPYWWGEVWNDISASEGCWCVWIRSRGNVIGELISREGGDGANWRRGSDPPQCLDQAGRRSDCLGGRRRGKWPDIRSGGLRSTSWGFFSRLLWALDQYWTTYSFELRDSIGMHCISLPTGRLPYMFIWPVGNCSGSIWHNSRRSSVCNTVDLCRFLIRSHGASSWGGLG